MSIFDEPIMIVGKAIELYKPPGPNDYLKVLQDCVMYCKKLYMHKAEIN